MRRRKSPNSEESVSVGRGENTSKVQSFALANSWVEVEVDLFSFISLDFLPSSRTSKFSGFCFAFSNELCDKLRLNGENAELCKHLNVAKHISLRGSVVRTVYFHFFSRKIHFHTYTLHKYYAKQQKRKQLSIEMKCLGKKKLVKIVHQQIKKKIIQKTHTKAYQTTNLLVEQRITQMVAQVQRRETS